MHCVCCVCVCQCWCMQIRDTTFSNTLPDDITNGTKKKKEEEEEQNEENETKEDRNMEEGEGEKKVTPSTFEQMVTKPMIPLVKR